MRPRSSGSVFDMGASSLGRAASLVVTPRLSTGCGRARFDVSWIFGLLCWKSSSYRRAASPTYGYRRQREWLPTVRSVLFLYPDADIHHTQWLGARGDRKGGSLHDKGNQ